MRRGGLRRGGLRRGGLRRGGMRSDFYGKVHHGHFYYYINYDNI
jgi:hypothetical protein